MQIILNIAGLFKAIVILGFWSAATVLLGCVLVIISKLLGPLTLKLLF